MQAFLHWAVTDGNSPTYLDQFHFQPLPASVAKLSDAQIVKISG
jgi:phosphate transport system substrate-binding protein